MDAIQYPGRNAGGQGHAELQKNRIRGPTCAGPVPQLLAVLSVLVDEQKMSKQCGSRVYLCFISGEGDIIIMFKS